MGFSNEDKAAWLDSEVMIELEKFADDVLSKPSDEEGWEEENFEEALEEFEKPTPELLEDIDNGDISKELHAAYNIAIINNLQKLASSFAKQSNIKVAYRIEQTVYELKDLFGRKN